MLSLFYVNNCVAVDIDAYRSASVSDVLPSVARLHWLRDVRSGHLAALTARFDGRFIWERGTSGASTTPFGLAGIR